MNDDKKTKKQLILELNDLRQAVRCDRSKGESDQEEFYRLATEHSDEAVVIISKDRRLFFNQRYLELAGCKTPEELQQRPFLSGVHPDDQKTIKGMIRLRRGETPLHHDMNADYSIRTVPSDIFEISSSPITYMGQPASLGYIRDISDRKAGRE